jgi:hypothetical protein
VISNLRLAVHQPANFDAQADDPGASSPIQGYAGHYCNVPRRTDPGIVACSMILSGLRVFDIRDPHHPREIAYFNAPVTPRAVSEGSNYAMSSPSFVPKRGEIWYSDGFSGFYAVRVTNGVWPFAKCRGKDATIVATRRKTAGSGAPDVIAGRRGRDEISARAGRDTVCSKGGNDRVRGGPGADRLLGQGGADTLRGGGDGDRLNGGPGKNLLRGGRGNDRIAAIRGRNRIACGPGRDIVISNRSSKVAEDCERVSRRAPRSKDPRCAGASARRAEPSCAPGFDGRASHLDPRTRERMTGVSWRRGCPVLLRDLRLLRVSHWGFDRRVHRGRLVVHRDAAGAMLRVMGTLYRHRYPIRRMRLIDAYGADDRRSMAADNTSAFNCRYVAGRPGVWSQHAFGRAIDVNPIENPYVTSSGYVSPPAGRPYANRSRHRRGMIHGGDSVVRGFASVGWEWGGNWPSVHDYQHFSANGH